MLRCGQLYLYASLPFGIVDLDLKHRKTPF
jgi:hypothetical protein